MADERVKQGDLRPEDRHVKSDLHTPTDAPKKELMGDSTVHTQTETPAPATMKGRADQTHDAGHSDEERGESPDDQRRRSSTGDPDPGRQVVPPDAKDAKANAKPAPASKK